MNNNFDEERIVRCIRDNDPVFKFDARKFISSAFGNHSYKYQRELMNIFYNTYSDNKSCNSISATNSYYTTYDTLW